jgi:O-antigen ligase
MKTENGKEIINKEVQQKGRRIDKISDSSGRLTIWKNILFIIKEKKIGLMGYGPQSDRFLLAQLKNNTSDKSRYVKIGNAYMFDTNASNSFLYAYLCGGIIGIALFISIYFMSIKVILYNIFKKKIFNHKNVLLNFSTITLIYLGLRAFFENSFSVFSLDYVFFIITYFIAYETKISSDKI